MQHTILRPKQALNKAYLRNKTSRAEMEGFKKALGTLLDSIDLSESEEHVKNHLRDFLKLAYYDKYGVNTKGKTDLVIHTGSTTKSPAGVLLEVKRPTNKGDMPSEDNLNYKAMHELVLYYLRERVEHKNNDLKQLVITSVYEWFVFDALEFDRIFYRNSQLKKDFTDWSQGKKSGSSTDFFYKEIAAPFLAALTETITFTHFNLKDFEKPLRNASTKDDVKLVALYKLLSPAHLLKEPFANDANSLDKSFYQELLHIIGLEEVKEGGRKLIRRKEKPNHGSLLEAAYQKLRSEDLVSGLDKPSGYGSTRDEQLFNVALELCITWMNRVLFLKLLEAQLISYHHGDKKYAFMSTQNLREFDDLNELFFDVLAERPAKRAANVRQKYNHIPYLNSSLFETTALEKHTLRISNLKDRSMLPLYPQTVLRDAQGKSLSKTQPELHTLEYLLRFLGSYDFGAEGKEEIQEENKTLITASVLGLIFEKINGYRDGSFYTPGFITMYMSREAIRRAVVQRFAEKYNWNIDTSAAGPAFESLQLHIHQHYTLDKLKEYNQLINSLRICDPAVGSGHYLVSALNELIVIKAELRLLLNRQGKPLHYGSIEVQNDELIVTDYNGDLFSYTVQQHPDGHRSINPQAQELQETLFHEKQTIIENCLFGVDINPNSVKICRLRLWIELLKNAYYQDQDAQDGGRIDRMVSESEADLTSPVCYANASGLREGFGTENGTGRFTELQTLPNIDINIKQGNSLLSRYPLTADLHEAFGKQGHSLQAYREAVLEYKHTNSKETKKRLVAFLDEIKQGFKTTLANNDPLRKKMAELRGQIQVMQNPDLFGAKKVDKKQLQQKQKQLQKLEEERESIETNKVFEGAFEWRFEFPEVLDEEGKYKGFDVVIGNPPYIRQEELGDFKIYLQKQYEVYAGTADILVYFYELGIGILREGGVLNFITSNKFMKANYGKPLRNYLRKYNLIQIVDFGELPVFDEASTFPAIVQVQKNQTNVEVEFSQIQALKFNDLTEVVCTTKQILPPEAFDENSWRLVNLKMLHLMNKLKVLGQPLEEYTSGTIRRGLLTGLNEAFIITAEQRTFLITSDSKSAEVIVPFAVGDDIRNYSIKENSKFLILTKIGLPIERYPAIFQYLKNFQTKLEKRTDKGEHWWELRACIYYDEFRKGKIAYPVIAKEPRFAYSTDEVYFNDKVFFIPTTDLALLGILNSKIIWCFLKNTCSVLGDAEKGGRLELRSIYTKNIPIATPDEETKASITSLVEQILRIKQADAAADTSGLEAEIDVLVYRLYNLTYEEVLLVEPGFAMSREAYELQEV